MANERFINRHPSSHWAIQAAGYQRTAELVLEQIKANRHEVDTLVYPLVYNSRHCMELWLKEIIENGSRLVDKNDIIPDNHNLERLWQIAKPILLEVYPELIQDPATPVAENVFKEFSQYDARSTSFRYPSDTKGNDSLPFRMMNVGNFADQVPPALNS